MTIRATQSWILRFPSNRLAAERSDEFFELIGVTVRDDSGEEGTGWTFTSDYGGGEAVRALLDTVLLDRLIGREADEVEVLNDELFHRTHRLGHGIASMAISAIDVALWDLRARQRGVSLAFMLGQRRASVPSYGSGKASPSLPLDDLVRSSAEYVAAGFDAVKIRVGRQPDQDIARVRAVREAIGPGPRILCDANERLSLPAALWLGRQLGDLDIYWFEEPILSQDIEGYRRLRAQLPMAVASGEHFHSRRDFAPFVTAGALDVLQPDLCFVGGFTEALKIGEMADMFGLAVAPHFMTVLHIHLAAALPRATYVEYYPFMDDLMEHGLELRDGQILVPDRPGHGVTFTPAAWDRYLVR
ncbi:mandelate racemase/muconate lactonizing enzyme family protein [Salipiger marinus]|jgi:L-alanine-DL-glutamate epimerase-like enolase superfamily enzyme|uniref:L-alanine-DL-glutamate epimerase n=1 Tax=Salipiger marinus TaxID=555512 RepID=A0A1G8K644_9RHOB|nr:MULTISPECIES: mandelate racemase/muconate lactonizing enzyme family protein [Salipiger]MCD1618725.1 mandelate racemase/muconate lactonizing enzyme family protein [Salipiger manganoxidans]MEB3417835.1 mandelate racemase/muconate lactonizing enzyme family protein [Salipiger manganoxidans]SDI38891.1 L-alanine-DL-glutamate epimerase [Salipiger marinus]HBM61640.1 mandelate racemase/muconate lactonizing enzyme family protein [Citreicella sp.]